MVAVSARPSPGLIARLSRKRESDYVDPSARIRFDRSLQRCVDTNADREGEVEIECSSSLPPLIGRSLMEISPPRHSLAEDWWLW